MGCRSNSLAERLLNLYDSGIGFCKTEIEAAATKQQKLQK
jgi:hypothetical protein